MSPILIVVVVVVVVVGGLAIRSDWSRRHMRGLSNGTGARFNARKDAQARTDKQGPGTSDPGPGGAGLGGF